MVKTALRLFISYGAAVVCLTSGPYASAANGTSAATVPWAGEEMPLPLAVRTPQDLAVKALAERQYLIFNLLAGGKAAFDSANFAVAATKWEALLRLPGLDPEIDRVIRPLAQQARTRAGGVSGLPAEPTPLTGSPPVPAQEVAEAAPEGASAPGGKTMVAVSGTVTGGGAFGAGGTVLWLTRTDGPTPRPRPGRGKVISQRNKTFFPRVLAVPVGTKIDFRNEDEIFHNVFSLSRPNQFDTGLYKQGATYSQNFLRPGLVQILCNIHSSMIAYVYVVNSPYYTQADSSGAFVIKGVLAGEYELQTWHEGSSKPTKQHVTVGGSPVRGLSIRLTGDKSLPSTVPDKSGRPRQAQLGY